MHVELVHRLCRGFRLSLPLYSRASRRERPRKAMLVHKPSARVAPGHDETAKPYTENDKNLQLAAPPAQTAVEIHLQEKNISLDWQTCEQQFAFTAHLILTHQNDGSLKARRRVSHSSAAPVALALALSISDFLVAHLAKCVDPSLRASFVYI